MSPQLPPPDMTKTTREILSRVGKMIPPLLEGFHKGQMGRVGVIGGSSDYTGAPYFSAMASARLGVDMSHIICESQAAQVIKTYSPNLMVHPLLQQSHRSPPSVSGYASDSAAAVIALLPRLHVLIIGPGLGRDDLILSTCASIISAARARNMPLVLDADALFLIQQRPELVQGYRECILTPNLVEFRRLCASKDLEEMTDDLEGGAAAGLARAFGGVTVVQKGERDFITDGKEVLVCDLKGGLKRSGGQGDTLTGCLGTFLAWRKAYLEGLWDHDGDMEDGELLALAAFGGCSVTRECSRLAFVKRGRSLQAGDLTDEVAAAFGNLFEGGGSKL